MTGRSPWIHDRIELGEDSEGHRLPNPHYHHWGPLISRSSTPAAPVEPPSGCRSACGCPGQFPGVNVQPCVWKRELAVSETRLKYGAFKFDCVDRVHKKRPYVRPTTVIFTTSQVQFIRKVRVHELEHVWWQFQKQRSPYWPTQDQKWLWTSC